MKPKKCKICKDKFTPIRPLQMVCGYQCSAIYAKEQKRKSWRKEKKKRKEAMKTKQDYEKELEAVVNRFIRLRDKDKPCISCGATNYTMSAGHYYPAGSYKNIRFDEDNIFGQCWYNCNKNKSGNLAEYRIGMIERIGIERVKALDERRLIPAHFTIPELKEMKIKYKKKCKELE